MTNKDNHPKSGLRFSFSDAARILIPVSGVAGLGVSGYLTYTHFANVAAVCVLNAKCETVLTSRFAEIWNIPLALIGMVMYLVIICLGLLLWRKESAWEHVTAAGILGVGLVGIIFTAYLYYLEIFVLHGFCSWCVISSIILAFIFIVSIFNFISIKRRLENTPHVRRLKLSDFVGW
jgi:uncharacterized membrane protein